MIKLQLFHNNCLKVLRSLPEESIDLIVTSPPYNAGKEYEKELTEEEYFDFIYPIVDQFKRVLKRDGRFAINVIFNINRVNGEFKTVLFPFFSWVNALQRSGLRIKENIIWDQCNSGCETAWGSWRSASSPHIRHMTENILVGYKNQWKKENLTFKESDMNPNEFMSFTVDKWRISPARNKLHPAVFPEEIPLRCIKLFSFVGDVVLDPFLGSGTTMKVARDLKRSCIGIEVDENCIKLCKKKLNWGTSFGDIKFEFYEGES